MKTNYPLQKSIGCQNEGQKTLLAALILKSALRDSPAVLVRAAVPAVLPKPAVLAQTAKPARAASSPVTAAQNTTGYAFGEIYLNSPAYPIGTAIPAIPAKPASAAVVGVPAIVAVPAVTAITSPAVVAVKGWEDAITINASNGKITITAELPVAGGVGIVGSNKTVISEITPSALQATGWVSNIVYALGEASLDNPEVATLEQYLYNHALQCEHVLNDTTRQVNGVTIPGKGLTITLYTAPSFDPNASIANQLDKVFSNPVNQGS